MRRFAYFGILLIALIGSQASAEQAAQQATPQTGVTNRKKDLRALFAFRREKFTENEARSQDFGFDILLSTLVPITPVVKGIESVGSSSSPLLFSTFFNVEGSVFLSFNYNWQAFLGFGYFNYDTRKQLGISDPKLPLFQQFEMSAIPIVAGVKYRFGTTDIVPYAGLGAGMAFGSRKAFYDFNKINYMEQSFTAIVGQVMGGFEFYIAPRAGIRLEASAYVMKVPQGGYAQNGDPANLPWFEFPSTLISMRYASGLFFLF